MNTCTSEIILVIAKLNCYTVWWYVSGYVKVDVTKINCSSKKLTKYCYFWNPKEYRKHMACSGILSKANIANYDNNKDKCLISVQSIYSHDSNETGYYHSEANCCNIASAGVLRFVVWPIRKQNIFTGAIKLQESLPVHWVSLSKLFRYLG